MCVEDSLKGDSRSVKDTSSHRPSRTSGQGTLSGRILPARVTKVRGRDFCDLDLLDGENGQVVAQGRLYQSESAAWKDTRLLADIPAYQPKSLLDAVFVTHQRVEEGKPLWYVHERWGLANPWADLTLAEDDIITGVVVRSIRPSGRSETAGYIVQLDVSSLVEHICASGAESSDLLQPDIEVFLPNEELPWTDGSLGYLPQDPRSRRMALEIGDPVRALATVSGPIHGYAINMGRSSRS